MPNFGVDEDIIRTQKHIADQEKKQGHTWTPKRDETGAWDVPEAYKSSTKSLAQVGSDPVCHSAGCPKSKWFGNAADKVVDYPDLVGKYGYDEDIIDSVGNEWMVSKAMGVPFNMPVYAQTESSSDPVCHSAGCTQYNWMDALRTKGEEPVVYQTGQALDQDVIRTWDNLDVAEKIKNHEWKFNQDVYDNRNKVGDVVEYDNGKTLDEDIVNTQSHLSAAEKKIGDWNIFADVKK